jgi:CheY-like chemotaxis protein
VSKRVLMVDDEEDLVWTTARQMARERPDLAFEGVTDPEEALARIRAAAPDLLITDVRMPKMSGLELLLAAREASPQLPVIAVTAYGSAEVRAEVQRSRSVEYVEKPFSFQSLLAAVDHCLSRQTGFSGAIELLALPDLIQLYALSRMTGVLRISRGPDAGAVWFDKGEIVHSCCAARVGAEAFYELLTWEGGSFAMEPGALAPQRTIGAGWQELLVEGCRLLDEVRHKEPEGGLAEGVEDSASGLAERVAGLWNVLGPQLSEAAPQALVVAAALRGDGALVLHGKPGSAAWSGAVSGVVEVVRRLSGGAAYGALECVAPDLGVAVAWDTGTQLALVFSDVLVGSTGPSRFRSNVARWRETCRAWVRSE